MTTPTDEEAVARMMKAAFDAGYPHIKIGEAFSIAWTEAQAIMREREEATSGRHGRWTMMLNRNGT
jgi:hypothetical protein